jgi:CBS-domain-containing membrane protein
MHGGMVILVFGVGLAIFWSGFLRVGAQSALLLAPLSATALLILCLVRALGF